ncbi:MAG: PASTA domain-containing protein [Burkholderiaceae bacterium]
MQALKHAVRVAAVLVVIGHADGALAQRLVCNQLPPSERDRARAAGQCRDLAPIIDVAPKPAPADAIDSSIAPQVPLGAGSNPAGLAPVPNVVGLSFDEARTRLTRFTLQRSYRSASEPGGTVLAQAPMAPARAPAGSAVSLVLSDGSLVRVPRVTDININEAQQRLQRDLELKAQPVVITSNQRVGTVIEQQPAEGTLVKRGSVVKLQVSAGQEGPEMIDVPNVVGMSFDRAKARLTRFSVEHSARPRSGAPSDAPEGQVVEQNPRAAARAVAGSAIMLTVSTAPRAAIEIFEMPNVIGRSYADATRSLAEFKVTRTESESPVGRDQILAQTPPPGSTLVAGDSVVLQVSAGPKLASVATTIDTAGSTVAAASKPSAARGVLTGVLAISAAVLLGLIAGGLLMRQLLLRRRAVAAADDVITSMSDLPVQGVSSVDILLEDDAATAPAVDSESGAAKPQPSKLESVDDKAKGPGS